MDLYKRNFGGRMTKGVVKFPYTSKKVIIATKGLPCTAKSAISELISSWARCPLISMDDLLDTLSIEKGYSAKSPPSPEEADHLHRLACNSLLKVARRNLSFSPFCVAVKTRLCSSFELDVLLRVAVSLPPVTLIIVECKIKNEHRFRAWLDYSVEMYGHKEWYKARTWKDIEDVQDEIDDRAWDDHARTLIDKYRDGFGKSPLVIKLVVDPFDDLNIDHQYTTTFYSLLNAINYLVLTGDQAQIEVFLLDGEDTQNSNEDKELSDEEVDLEFIKDSYTIVQYDELQRSLFKMELKAFKYKERSKYICSTEGSDCVFKFFVLEDHRYGLSNDEKIYCGVCEDLVHGGQPIYTCYFCVLTMHDSCARIINMEFLHVVPYRPNRRPWCNYPDLLKEKHVCNSCMDNGKGFSEKCKSCLFHTHLRCKMLPTIINHEAHKHLLSIRLLENLVVCKACGGIHEATWYICHICKFYFEAECIFLPTQVMHEHGGYEHLMKLMHSYKVGMEQEEPYWCDFCYCDMDPENWFYCCQECLYYVTHTCCVREETIIKARRHDNLPIQM